MPLQLETLFKTPSPFIPEGCTLLTWNDINPNITEQDLDNFILDTGVTLTNKEKSFLITRNAGKPTPNTFDSRRVKGRVFDKFLSFNSDDTDNVFTTRYTLSEQLPDYLIPVIIVEGGGYICFNLNKCCKMMFWNPATGETECLSKDLFSFINSLK